MQVILLERVEKLGQMGDVVKVKDGFARNFLLPQKKALRATKANREYFETAEGAARSPQSGTQSRGERGRREARRQDLRAAAPGGRPRPALRLVSPRDIADVITAGGFTVDRTQVPLDKAIKAHRPASR